MKRVSAKREELALARCLLLPPVSTSVDDSDLPVALRKGKRSCVTHHSIAQYVSYSGISPPYHAYLAATDSIRIPRKVSEALQHPSW